MSSLNLARMIHNSIPRATHHAQSEFKMQRNRAMSTFSLVVVVLVATGCTAKERHMSALTNTRTTGNQIQHIVALQEMIKKDPPATSRCPEYPAGYGGFVVSCRSK